MSRDLTVVDRYADAMRRELRANEQKEGWKTVPIQAMVISMLYHAAKLTVAVLKENPDAILEFAADVGNEAMMVADIAGVLDGSPRPNRAILLRDVVFDASAGGNVTAWAEKESDEPSQASCGLMDAAKDFVKEVEKVMDGVQNDPHFEVGAP